MPAFSNPSSGGGVVLVLGTSLVSFSFRDAPVGRHSDDNDGASRGGGQCGLEPCGPERVHFNKLRIRCCTFTSHNRALTDGNAAARPAGQTAEAQPTHADLVAGDSVAGDLSQ